MSAGLALVILVVVIVVAGLGGYAGLSSVVPPTATRSGCEPTSACSSLANTNDVTLFIPYTVNPGQTFSMVAVGTSIQAAVGVSGPEEIDPFP